MSNIPDRNEDEHREYMRYSIFQACAIDDIEVNAECLRVLAALGSYASKRNDYWCWTSREKIARRMGVTPSAITPHVNKLAELGYIQLLHDFTATGKQMSNAYRLIMDYELPPERQRSMHERPRAGIGGRKKSAPKDATGVTQPVTPRGNSELRVGVTQPVTQIWESESENLRNREDESSRVSFQNRKQKTAEAERPRSMPTAGNTALAIETSAWTPDPTPPLAPPPPPQRQPVVGVEKFLYWQQVRSLVEKRFNGAFIRGYFDRCKLYERGSGDFAVVCPTPFVQEQIVCRARDEIVLQLAAVVRSHVELEVIVG